jgi:hypothetical protein
MYEHYSIDSMVTKLDLKEAQDLMNEISDQWEDEQTEFGKLLTGVFDWDYKKTPQGIEVLIPNLRNGGSIPKNDNASKKFGFDIYGDCFLKVQFNEPPVE